MTATDSSDSDGMLVAEDVEWLGEWEIDQLVTAAADSADDVGALPSWRRADILLRASELIAADVESLARVIVSEAGKTIREARDEVRRASETLAMSGEEARRFAGDLIDFEAQYRGEGTVGWVGRFPVGTVIGVTPFNGPLLGPAQKVGPAFAAGNAVLVKPSPRTPRSARSIVEAMVNAGAPSGSVGTALCANELADTLLGHSGVSFISFTGSDRVGWDLKRRFPETPMILELGGNGATIVASDADPHRAATECVAGAMGMAGQACVSVQRVYVHEAIADSFAEEAAAAAARLVVGEPLDESTDVGPMIDAASADRAHGLIKDAIAAGAQALCGGDRSGRFLSPCVLDHATDEMAVVTDEAFAPVLVLLRFTDLDDALARANDSPYGLNCAVFTGNFQTALTCYRRLDFGTVTVNRHHSWRVDHMPFGGWKRSGWGREGVRDAMLSLSRVKVFALDVDGFAGSALDAD